MGGTFIRLFVRAIGNPKQHWQDRNGLHKSLQVLSPVLSSEQLFLEPLSRQSSASVGKLNVVNIGAQANEKMYIGSMSEMIFIQIQR